MISRWVGLGLMCVAVTAAAQGGPLTLRDIADKKPRKLSKEEVTALMPGAKLARVSARGNRHNWSNDSGGTFYATSDNMGTGFDPRAQGKPTTVPGKWHISDDGRYCVLIEWRGVPTEEWCRFVFEANDGNYYMARSDSVATERVEKFEIQKK
jgi:Protein of unknown function (DUF995)